MKPIRVLALGTILVFGFVMGAQAQTENTSDSDQPTTQSEEKVAPSTDQQTAPQSEPTTPAPDSNSDSE